VSARQPSWADLEIFLATAKGGTLAAAADHLGVNPSTVQRRIGKLESDMATRLFDRGRRGYSLTATGEDLLEHALTIEAEVLAVSRKVSGRDQALEGVVRVSTVDDVASYVFPPWLGEFRRLHPRLTLVLDIASSFTDLTRRQADVAIRFGHAPVDGDVIDKRVGYSGLALYGSREYLAERGRPESLEQLHEHYIVCGAERMSALGMEQVIQRHCDPKKIAYRSGSMLGRYAAVREGLGIGYLSVFVGEQDPNLERLDLEEAFMVEPMRVLVHVDLRRNARVRAFVDFICERIRGARDLLEGVSLGERR
jgi:DNA-binding transcriptional LysR family regulator